MGANGVELTGSARGICDGRTLSKRQSVVDQLILDTALTFFSATAAASAPVIWWGATHILGGRQRISNTENHSRFRSHKSS